MAGNKKLTRRVKALQRQVRALRAVTIRAIASIEGLRRDLRQS